MGAYLIGPGLILFVALFWADTALALEPSNESSDPLNAIYYEKISLLKSLIHDDQKLKDLQIGDLKLTLPYMAILMHSPRALQALIQQGVDFNQANIFGVTPLHLAAYHNDAEACRILMRAGARLTMLNRLGQTPLALAKEKGSAECLHAMTN